MNPETYGVIFTVPTSRKAATRWVAAVAGAFGPGFHGDIPAADYVTDEGVPYFTPSEVEVFDLALSAAWRYVDVNAEALRALDAR